MREVCLSLGSNHGLRRRNVEDAMDWIRKILTECRSSSIYETKAFHGYGPAYFNAVMSGYSSLDHDSLNRMLKDYEIKCGRTVEARDRNEVIIDIDIVLWDKEIVRPTDYSREFFQKGYKEIVR